MNIKRKAWWLFAAVSLLCLAACNKPQSKPLPAQKVEVQVVATYLNAKSLWVTCVKFEDNTRCELNGRLANDGEKFPVWRRGNDIMLQDPN